MDLQLQRNSIIINVFIIRPLIFVLAFHGVCSMDLRTVVPFQESE